MFDLIHLEACRPVLPQRCFPVVVPGLDVGDSEHCAVRNHEQTDKLLGALPSEQTPRLLSQGSEGLSAACTQHGPSQLRLGVETHFSLCAVTMGGCVTPGTQRGRPDCPPP